MSEITLDYYDEELIKDFLGELEDAREEAERCCGNLKQRPGAPALLDELFRTLHSVKSNLRMMGLVRYSDLVHAFENVLDQVRNGEVGYEPVMADLFLLSVEEVQRLCVEHFAGGAIDEERCQQLERPLGRIAFNSREGIEGAVKGVIRLLDPGFLDEEPPPAAVPPATPSPPPAAATDPEAAAVERFAAMGRKAEERLPGWDGRTARIVELALELNREGGEPVPPRQLAAAGWMHAVGLCRVAPAWLDQLDAPPARREPSVAAYPAMGAALLRKAPGWEAAARIVEQQRERWDGGGYPRGLAGEAIEAGARILALAGAFEGRPDGVAGDRRAVLQAVAAINAEAGQRFDPAWVKRFNGVIRRRYVG
ncbi:HD-GYP domain-containing protein [Endothiovibrio diazotrophicus]